ncbi:RagB/SusD family nutrient uptake outer membrane protein [Fulvivirga sedimenti]|uniref:RagB/SusD family nutrient uptake outer membrane protein n=1 Tax=Fulvivirga sedimenti TaxID=2879465 RepID=A0A9X1HVU1_9BACT|nr:RagB/SusD family nutrient uptake outer membrane protein [Fulvivirga sedimenti]MCA6079183.1 RagB/SusD family nutrient uptake outer membrane protein [Fulvivirga sedimenti]
MKKLIYYSAFIASLTMVSTSCIEPDQEVFSSIPRDVVLSSTDPDVLASLAKSAYSPIRGTWGGHNSLWSMHEVASDEMVITQKGPDWEDGGQWIRMHRHEYTPSEESINNAWGYCFGAIGQVNTLLRQFGESEALSAELRTLRALVYLWLIDAYGNVPIILETDDNPSPPTNSRQEIFNFIESEVTASLPFLAQERTYTRVNYYVGQMILAKLYLNAEVYTGTARWADAEEATQAIISGGVYSLESDFFANFVTDNAGSVENIFVINYDQDNAGGFNLGQMTLHYLSQNTYNLQEQPWNGYSSLEDFYNSFDEDDERIDSFLEGPQFSSSGEPLIDLSAEPNDPDGPALNFTPEINMLAPGAFRQAGVRVGKWEFATGAQQSLSNDFPIFRYSDVLLMHAEAKWRQGDGSAVDFVNQVRARAGIAPLASLNADNLLAERGREMFAEGYRRSDLIRFGKYNDPWWEKPASNASVNIFPIPLPQLQRNQNLEQNPGYN